MTSKIFYPKNLKSKIIFRISDRCATNCNYCNKNERSKINRYYLDEKIIIEKIKKLSFLSSNTFIYMLYGGESFLMPGLEKILDYMKKAGIKKVLLHENLDFDIIKLKKIQKLNKIFNFSIEICRVIEKKSEIKKMFNILKKFSKLNYEININIKLSPSKFFKIIKYFKNTYRYIIKNDTINFYVKNNINLSFILKENFIINNNKKIIENINYKKCTIGKSYEIEGNKIIIEDELEINDNNKLIFHNNVLCYMSNIHISDIGISKENIINNFKIFKETFIKEKNLKLIKKSCYECYENRNK